MKITLCLLTMNEVIGCKNDVPQINRDQFDEIYAIDAGSTDGTIEYLESMNIPVYIQPKKGLNAACIYAFERCLTDALIFFHPKGSVTVSEAEKFRQYFEQGYDLVVASRNIKEARNEEDNQIFRPRKWFVSLLAITSAALFWRGKGTMVWDVLHGFRGMTVDGFSKINPVDYGLSIDLEMVSRSYKKNLKRIEFPTIEVKRLAGTTHFKAFPTGKKLLKYLVKEMLRKD
ncbi:MAG: glycosyltransferase [Chloroflexi bacterium]|nr:glycosyltransferase [Chloroflexota bacterium]